MARMNSKEMNLASKLGKQLKCPICRRKLKNNWGKDNWFQCPKCEMTVKLWVVEGFFEDEIFEGVHLEVLDEDKDLE